MSQCVLVCVGHCSALLMSVYFMLVSQKVHHSVFKQKKLLQPLTLLTENFKMTCVRAVNCPGGALPSQFSQYHAIN